MSINGQDKERGGYQMNAQGHGSKGSEEKRGFRITGVVIAMLMAIGTVGISIDTSVSNVSGTSYDAEWGYLPGHAGDNNYIWVSNGLVNLSYTKGHFQVNSTDGKASWTNMREVIQFNNTAMTTIQQLYSYYNQSCNIHPFSDSLGSGLEWQLMLWKPTVTSVGYGNVSLWWRVYDQENFIVHWVETKNSYGYDVNWTQAYFNSMYTDTQHGVKGGLKVGTTTTNMQKWFPNYAAAYRYGVSQSEAWTGSGTSRGTTSLHQELPPVFVVTSSDSQKGMVIGQITSEQSGFRANLTSGASDTADYGLQTTLVDFAGTVPSIAYYMPRMKVAVDANASSDKLLIGFADTNNLADILSVWTDAILSENTFKAESMPYSDGVFWTSWNAYGRYMNDTIIREMIDFIATNYPEIDWIGIDDGWQVGSGTASAQDPLSMQVDTSRFPDMANLVSYAHSKDLKMCLWIGMQMYQAGWMNATHPEWRMKENTGNYIFDAYSRFWYADITRTGYLAYVTTQLQAMQTDWGIDGFKLDFQPLIPGYDRNPRPVNWNTTAPQAHTAYWNAVKDGTTACELMLSAIRITSNPFQGGQAFNVWRSGVDVINFPSLKSGFVNYSNIPLLDITARTGNRLGLADLDMITLNRNGVQTTAAYVRAHTSLVVATGTFPEVSFRLSDSALLFDELEPLWREQNYNGSRYMNGQNGAEHVNSPTVFGQFPGDFHPTDTPDATIALINWNATASSVTFSASDFGGGATNTILYEMNQTFRGMGASISHLIQSSDGCLLHLYSGTGVAINPDAYWGPSGSLIATWSLTGNVPITFTLSGLDSTVGYRVYQDGELVYQQDKGFETISFTATGGGTFQVVTWEAPLYTPMGASFTYSSIGANYYFADRSYGPIVSWLWNFGDGTGSSSQNPTHKYKDTGSYRVTLTVYDAQGRSSVASTVVEVSLDETNPIDETEDGWDIWFSDELTVQVYPIGLLAGGLILMALARFGPEWPIVTRRGRAVIGSLMVAVAAYWFLFSDHAIISL